MADNLVLLYLLYSSFVHVRHQLNIALYNVKAYLRRSWTGIMKRLVLLSVSGPTRFTIFGRVVWTSEDAVKYKCEDF